MSDSSFRAERGALMDSSRNTSSLRDNAEPVHNTEINILLLGETGLGKSTFINSFAHFMNFETLEEAAKGDPICLIPARFVITDSDYNRQTVTCGHDPNEHNDSPGQSATEQCRAYCFSDGDTMVHLIDAPGIGDTRGLDHDKKNFDNTLSFIAEYEVLHLICILLKPDMSRLSTSFKYCLKQLFYHLQKDASENIVFLFTHTRATLYRPRNTLDLLEEVLGEIRHNPPHVSIPIHKGTMYCLDNDWFQFLIATHHSITFDDSERKEYAFSYKKSLDECTRLLHYIGSGIDGRPLPPHSIQNTLSVNETRRLILSLNQPIAQITEEIDKNIELIKEMEERVANSNDNMATILENLQNCKKTLTFGFLDFIPIINLFTIAVKYFKVKKAEQQFKVHETSLDQTESNKKLMEELLEQLHTAKANFEQERQKIMNAAATFSEFLKNNAVITYNDSYREYLNEQIEVAKQSKPHEDNAPNRLSVLKRIFQDYEKEKSILEEAFTKAPDTKSRITLEYNNNLIKELYRLEMTGDTIKDLHGKSQSKRGSDMRHEIPQAVPPSRGLQLFKVFKSNSSSNLPVPRFAIAYL